jgi:hypothetical protein
MVKKECLAKKAYARQKVVLLKSPAESVVFHPDSAEQEASAHPRGTGRQP